MVSSSGLSSSFLFVNAPGTLPKILCETLISVFPKFSPVKYILAASSTWWINFWWLIVSWLSPKLGTIQFLSSSSSVIPEVLLSIKLGCSFCSSSDTIIASSTPIASIILVTIPIVLGMIVSSLVIVSILLLFFSRLIKCGEKQKAKRCYFFAFINIPLSFFIPLSIEVATSNTVIITSAFLS